MCSSDLTVRALLPAGEAGDFNQALMELGATVCTPARPSCLVCPVRASCRGVDAPDRYPTKDPKPESPRAEAVAALIRSEGRTLLARRPDTGLLAGLWEPPGGPGTDLAAVLAERAGVQLVSATPLGTVTHVFSHLRLEVTVHEASVTGDPLPGGYQDVRWVPTADVDGMALSTLARKMLRLGSAAGATRHTRPGPRRPATPS